MAQWINVLRNNGFINPTRVLFLCEKIEALAIVELGLMAGWQSGKPAGRLLGRRICCKVRKFKFCIFDFFKMHIRHLE